MKRLVWIFLWLCFAFTPDNTPAVKVPGPLTLCSPVRNILSITGSFGELRYNHFHGGVDIRSSFGGPGVDDILSAADGYVSKIIIDSEDLGKSLYITHPNGLMSVYGHLQDFREDLKEYIRQKQYETRKFQQELYFTEDQFPVKAGDFVAIMGNSGSSRGKHLHFEIRNAEGEEVWDPLMFGLPVDDSRAPSIHRIKLYGFDLQGQEVSSKVYSGPRQLNNHPVFQVPGEVFSLGIDALDRTDRSWNYTGIKSIQVYVDGELHYHLSLDKWKREDTKYINAHVDHRTPKGNFHRCFLLSGNQMNLYNTHENDGFIFMNDSTVHQVHVIVGDGSGNYTDLDFGIKKSAYHSKPLSQKFADTLYHNEERKFGDDKASIFFRKGSVYEDLNCEMRTAENKAKNAVSDWYGVVPAQTPIHYPVEVRLAADSRMQELWKDKCFIAMKRGNAITNLGGIWENGQLVARSRYLGMFSIMVDTVAPTLKWLVPKRKKSCLNALRFILNDNIMATRELPDMKVDAFIDGQWVLMEYDKKCKLISYQFEPWLGKGHHNYEVVVSDNLGNTRSYNGSFER